MARSLLLDDPEDFTLIVHVAAVPTRGPWQLDYKLFEVAIPFEADPWDAEEIAHAFIERAHAADGEESLGLDSSAWTIYDIMGAELRDGANCLLTRLDKYGNWQETTITPRLSPDTERVESYGWTGDLSWGWGGIRDRAAVAAQIVAYCRAHGHDALLA